MSLKATKTRKRLVLLVAAVVGLGCAGGGLWAVKKYRTRAWYANERVEGMRAASEGRAQETIKHLAYWLHRNPGDVEALRTYTKHRLSVEEEDNRHVRDMIARMRHLVELQPDDMTARRELMQLYARYGLTTESLDVANAILAKHPKDVEATRGRLTALARLRRWEEARTSAEQWAALAPADPEPVMQVLEVMGQLDRPANEIVERAKKFAAADPKAPVSQMVMGWAYLVTGDFPSAQNMMRQAAAQKAPNPEFARTMVDQLNRVALYDDALQLLKKLADESPDDLDVRRALVRRMWELNRANDVIALTEADAAKLGHEAVALRAIAQGWLGKADEAKQTIATLPTGKGDALAEAWAAIARQETGQETIEPRKLLELCQKAAVKDSPGLYLRYYMGHAYAQLDEGELAIDMWQRLSGANMTWSLPLVRLSEVRLAKGRSAMAMMAAEMAVRRAPASPVAAINLARVWAANVESGQAERTDQLLNLIGSIRKSLPQEETTLSMQVSLLSNNGRKDEAKAEIAKALAAENVPSEQTLIRLAAVSRAYDLGMAEECFARSEQAHGVTPDLAYARSIHKFSRGAAPEGLTLLKDARQKAKDGDSLPWQLAWARYLEVTQDPSAKDEWVRIADANPENRAVQQTVLNVRSTRADRAFVERTIERLRKLTGDEGVTWKLARARWLLDGAKNDQDLTQASMLLRDVIRASEDALEPHVLLAQTYERLNNTNGAVEEMRLAAAIDPSNTQVALYLSKLLQKRGEFDKAREELARVSKDKNVSAEQRRQAAVLMSQQGDAKRAIELLQEGEAQEKEGSNQLLLAMLYRQRNEPAKAEEIVKRLLQQPNPEPVAIQLAADLYAQQGRRAEADQALAMLDKMQLKPGLKELLLADHACRYLGPDRAIELFRAALKAAPDNASAWRALIGYYAHLGRATELAATAEEAVKAVPGDAAVREIAANRDLLGKAAQDAETRALVVPFLGDPKPQTPSLAAIDILVRSKTNGESPDQTAAKLRKIVDANPTFAPLQTILVRRYIRANRTEDALQLASRAVQLFPNDAQPAQLAVEAMLASERWAEALGFARTWRERTLSNPLPADMAIATCLQKIGQPQQAVDVMATYVPKALENPTAGAQVIVLYAQLLNHAGQTDKAADVLWPLAQRDGEWRRVWMQIATQLPKTQAVAWLNRVEAVVPADAQQERVVLASMWNVVGTRFADAAAVTKGKGTFEALLARPDVSAETVLASGIASENSGDLPAADAAYRRVLSMDAESLVARNNLAMVILKSGGNTAEALELAKAAVQKQPKLATLYDTLAQVQAKDKDVNGAVGSLRKALELEPNSVEWRVHLAQVLMDGGRPAEAEKVVQEIALLPVDRNPVSEQTKQQLQQIKADLSKKVSASVQTQ